MRNHYKVLAIIVSALILPGLLTADPCYAKDKLQAFQQDVNDTAAAIDNIISSINESANTITRTINNISNAVKSASAKGADAAGKQVNSISSKCFPFDPASLDIAEFKAGWAVVDKAQPNRAIVFARNENRADIELAQQAIQQMGINEVCHSERFVYYLASGKAAEGTFQGEKGCMQFDPSALAIEQRPIRSKDNPEEVRGSVWVLTDGKKVVYSAGNSETAADSTLGIIRNFQFTNRCRAGFNYMRR